LDIVVHVLKHLAIKTTCGSEGKPLILGKQTAIPIVYDIGQVSDDMDAVPKRKIPVK